MIENKQQIVYWWSFFSYYGYDIKSFLNQSVIKT